MADKFQLKALITGVDKLSPVLKGLQGRIKGWRRSLEDAGAGALPMAAGLAVGLGAAAKAFADLEDSAVGLKVAMMGAGGVVAPEFQKISDLATGLGNKLPGTTADFQNMMTMLVRQGISAKAILGGMGEATAYLAVQLKKTPEQAAEFAAKLQDATKTTEADMMGLMDVIQKAFYLGVDDNNMLAAFTKLAPAMDTIKQKGLAGAKALAPLVVMADQAGLSGEAAGNAYRKVFQSVLDTGKMAKANNLLGKKGIKLDFTDGKGEFGGIQQMFAQLDKLKNLNTVDRLSVLKTIFGDDAETLQAVSLLITKGAKGYGETEQKMAKQADLQRRVNAQLGTLKNLWEAATGTFMNGLAAIGETFAPELKALTEWLGTAAEKLQRFAKDNPQVIRGLIGMATALVGLKLGFLAAAYGMKILGAVTSLTPLGIALRALALLAGYMIANWSTIGPWFAQLWTGIKTVFSASWEFIKNAFLNFAPLGLIIKNWEPLVAWFKGFAARLAPIIDPIINGAKWVGEKVGGLLGGGGEKSGAPAPKPAPINARAPQTAQVGGTVHIKLDQDGRARVQQIKSDNPRVGINVDAGLMTVGR